MPFTASAHRVPTVVAVALLLGLGGSACRPSEPVVVGVATSPEFVDAARMAVEHALEEGPLPGLDTIMITEGGNTAAPAIGAAEALVAAEGIVGVVGHSNSAASLAAAPLYNEHEIVQIAPTSSAVTYSRAGPYSFRLVPPDDRQGAFLAARLADLLPNGGPITLFYVNDDYGRGLRRAFLESLDSSAFAVLLDLPHTEREVLPADIEAAGRALAQARPQAVIWLGRGTVLDQYLPAIREAVPGVPLLAGDAVSSVGQRPGDEELRRGIRYVDFVDLTSTDPLRRFSTEYEARFGRRAAGPDVLTYDAVRLLIDAIRAGARDGAAVRDHLQALGRAHPPWVGLTGTVTFDERGDVDRSYVMVLHESGGGR